MTESVSKVQVAVIQASPVMYDREATVEKACRLIAEAAAGGAQLIAFPEAYVAGYPRGMTFGTAVGIRRPEGRRSWQRYWDNAVDVPGPATEVLGAAAAKAGAYVTIGVMERDARFRGGRVYCTLLYFGPDGQLLGKHRKLQPVAAEKLLWGQGDGSTLTVIGTPLGRIGGLLCWENYMPLARAALYGKGLDIYLAPTVDDRDTWQPSMRHIAMEGRCFVIAPCQYWTKSMVPEGFDVFDELAAMPEVLCRGGSVVVSPLGEVLAGPLYGEEGMLTVTLDLADVTRGRYDMDTINEYGRPDVFELRVNETEQTVVKYDGQ